MKQDHLKKVRNNMYLEISARQSGKTARLLSAISNIVTEQIYKPIIVVPNSQNVETMKRNLKCARIDHVDVYSSTSKKQMYELYCLLQGSPTEYRVFYDEFDFFDVEGRIFDKNGYYCTTPAKIRKRRDPKNKTDFLLQLVKYKKNRFKNYESLKKLSKDYPDNERWGIFFDDYYTKPQTIEPEQDMKIYHNKDVEEEILRMLIGKLIDALNIPLNINEGTKS